jgi:hypothetical protein
MNCKSFYSPVQRLRTTSVGRPLLWAAACIFAVVTRASAGDAPPWMHALVNVQLPSYDEKSNAVLLYSERNVSIMSADKMHTRVREAYRILRPEGRDRGTVAVRFDSQTKVTDLHGWCIPAQGKDYEVSDKNAVDRAYKPGWEQATDAKVRILNIPAPDVGNIVGYEYDMEGSPVFLQDIWYFQGADPVREARYSLLLPTGWEYKASWLNHAEVQPAHLGGNSWQWVVGDLKGIREESHMPPFQGVAGQMFVSFFSSGGAELNSNVDWSMMGKWYSSLISERLEASPEIKQEVAALTAGKTSTLQKMQAFANFVQQDIRYVAIELGIGGYQPHAAAEVFSHRYGDCKDKATLMRSMLREIGIDSYHVVIYTERDAVRPQTPANHGFNHAILAIKLPEGVDDPSLVATVLHLQLGKLLIFDPTNEFIPFGQLPGYEQASYALLVTPDGGELIETPEEPPIMNSIRRSAKLMLDATGALKGEVEEIRLGMRAYSERRRLSLVAKDTDRIKPIEEILAGSLTTFHITKATLINFQQTDKPFGFRYSFVSDNYAKTAGGLLLLRPRVIGVKGEGFLETKEPRRFPIELEEPTRDTDSFEITIPSGYVVDDLPPSVDADVGFASYHSKTVVNGNVVGYTRTFEIKELTVPVDKAEELRKLYRLIATDERNTVVLKPAP